MESHSKATEARSASPDCSKWRPIPSDDNCADWTTDDGWILTTGYWDDDGFWRDIATWNDGASNWDD